jgi:hypothetical protein
MSVVVCEACAGPIVTPGHGRRYCESCSPPAAVQTRVCSHGLIGPCASCWTVGYLKRRARKTGGNLAGQPKPTDASRRAALRAHLVDERRRLDESGLDPVEQAWCWDWVQSLYAGVAH